MKTPHRPPKAKPAKPAKPAKAVKAEFLWAYPNGGDCEIVTDVPPRPADIKAGWANPVFVLDADASSIEQMAEAVSVLIYKQFHGREPHPEYARGYIENARAILSQLGLVAPRDGKKKQK